MRRISSAPPNAFLGHQISVCNEEIRNRDKKFTEYKITVAFEGKNWCVYRRYSEFYRLFEMLRKEYPHVTLKLPAKKLFGSLRSDVVLNRREGLDSFVHQLTSNQLMLFNEAVRKFFGISSDNYSALPNTPDGSGRNSQEIGHKNSSRHDSGYQSEDKDIVNLGPSEMLQAVPGDFEFLKVIGKGSFGKVFLAKQKSNGTLCAVKVLRKDQIKRRNEIRHIMSERNVLVTSVRHPFLISLHFSFQTPEKLYFVLDYAGGGELFFHLQKERCFSEVRAKFYSAEIASALGYLHSKDIIYRDLKPENILLDSEGHIKLTDFGLCKEGVSGNDTTQTFCGTPEYLAPEVILKQPYDKTVDWWCLGCVLYEMLFGLPPFYSRDHREMYEQILHRPLTIGRNASVSAKDFLYQLLKKDSNKRLGSRNDLDDLKEHPFFATFNWSDLLARKVTPPFVPQIKDPLDVRNIDPEFTKEPIPESVGRLCVLSASVQEADETFKGFSFGPIPEFLD